MGDYITEAVAAIFDHDWIFSNFFCLDRESEVLFRITCCIRLKIAFYILDRTLFDLIFQKALEQQGSMALTIRLNSEVIKYHQEKRII